MASEERRRACFWWRVAFWFGNDDGEREKRGERAKSGGNHSRRETLPLRRPTACTRLTMVAPMRVAAGRAKVAASAPGRASHSQGPRSKFAPNAPQLVPCIALCPRAAARAIALRPNATVRPPIAALAPLHALLLAARRLNTLRRAALLAWS